MEREKIHDRSFLDSLDIYGAFINNIYGWNHLHTNENVHLIFMSKNAECSKTAILQTGHSAFSNFFGDIFKNKLKKIDSI